jgi:hypothetical protein
MTKIAGSGSISQRHGSADPDPPQNVMDPRHCWYRTCTPFFKDKMSYRSYRTVEIKAFLTILLDDGRIWSRMRNYD